METWPYLDTLIEGSDLSVSDYFDFSLSAAVLSDVQLPQLKGLSLRLRYYDGVPVTGLDLSWLGCARSFSLSLRLIAGFNAEVLKLLQTACLPGDSLHLHVQGEVPCSTAQAMLADLRLSSLQVED